MWGSVTLYHFNNRDLKCPAACLLCYVSCQTIGTSQHDAKLNVTEFFVQEENSCQQVSVGKVWGQEKCGPWLSRGPVGRTSWVSVGVCEQFEPCFRHLHYIIGAFQVHLPSYALVMAGLPGSGEDHLFQSKPCASCSMQPALPHGYLPLN